MQVNPTKFGIGALIIIGLFCVSAPQVFAHTLETDGDIGVLFHTDPDDAPIAGQPANFWFLFEKKGDDYEPNAYDVSVSIAEGTTTVYTTPVSVADTDSGPVASFSYPLPDVGDYTVKVSGTPKDADAVPFNLSYTVHAYADTGEGIAPAVPQETAAKKYWPYIAAAGVLVIAALVFLTKKRPQ